MFGLDNEMSTDPNAQTQQHEGRRYGISRSAGRCASSPEGRRSGLKTHIVHSRTEPRGVADKPVVEISAIIKKQINN